MLPLSCPTTTAFPKKETGRFLRESADVLVLGPPGLGKSHLCQAIGYAVIKAGFAVMYRSIFDVVRDFRHKADFGGEDKTLERYLKPDLLIIDDMGMKQLPKRSGECLFEIILRRHDVKSTMMTSNRPLEDWGKLIGDVPAVSVILERFLERLKLIQITGQSYRLRNRSTGDARSTTKEADATPKTDTSDPRVEGRGRSFDQEKLLKKENSDRLNRQVIGRARLQDKPGAAHHGQSCVLAKSSFKLPNETNIHMSVLK